MDMTLTNTRPSVWPKSTSWRTNTGIAAVRVSTMVLTQVFVFYTFVNIWGKKRQNRQYVQYAL